jgi:hypothetical protein
MKKLLSIIVLGLLLSGCGEIESPSTIKTPKFDRYSLQMNTTIFGWTIESNRPVPDVVAATKYILEKEGWKLTCIVSDFLKTTNCRLP